MGKTTKVLGTKFKKNVKTPEIPMGKTKTVLGNIKLPPPLNFTCNWEDQQRYQGILNSHPRNDDDDVDDDDGDDDDDFDDHDDDVVDDDD